MQVQEKMSLPNLQSLRNELKRVNHAERYRSVLRSTIYALIVVAAVSVLVATLWMPVIRVYGYSMKPTLEAGDIIVSVKSGSFKPGEMVAFYANNKLLIKRVIAGPSDWVVIDKEGTVYINEKRLKEDYISEFSLGNCNIEFPYQVPESCWFVVGDQRATSIDSRNTAIGCIYEEQIVGRIVLRIWPLSAIERF
jgi:signal peptidase I